MKLGFTGTRRGMTREQYATFCGIVKGDGIKTMLNGACVGADRDAVCAAWHTNITIMFFPGDKEQQDWAAGLDRPNIQVYDRKTTFGTTEGRAGVYLKRNRVIASMCDFLVATPSERREFTRSGTWATVRYARAQRKTIVIIKPDGAIEGPCGSVLAETIRKGA